MQFLDDEYFQAKKSCIMKNAALSNASSSLYNFLLQRQSAVLHKILQYTSYFKHVLFSNQWETVFWGVGSFMTSYL